MPILGALVVLLQAVFSMHAVRTGRSRAWVWAIMLLPGFGCAAYFLTQMLPDLLGRRAVPADGERLINAVDPREALRRRKEALLTDDSVDSRVQLADECMEVGLNIEAITLLETALTGTQGGGIQGAGTHEAGPHEAGRQEADPQGADPDIMLKLAEAQFRADDAQACVATLDALIEANPDFRSTIGHLLYARALTALGQLDAAVEEYEVLLGSYPGEQARVRFAQLLEQRGELERAAQVYAEALSSAERSPADYQRREREWLELAAARVRKLS